MRTLSIVIPLALAISACSLYWDDKKQPHIQGPTYPDAHVFAPDAYVPGDGSGSGCHGSNSYPDAGIWGDDGGQIYPDAGTYGYPDGH